MVLIQFEQVENPILSTYRISSVTLVHEAVVKNNIPAVLFEGTGRCCDLFAKGSNLYNQYLKQFNLDDENLE